MERSGSTDGASLLMDRHWGFIGDSLGIAPHANPHEQNRSNKEMNQ